jgi:hypothetical protein
MSEPGGGNRPAPDENKKDKKDENSPPWWAAATLVIIGALLIMIFGFAMRATGHSAAVLVILLMLAAASIASGGLLGFLFGIPHAPKEASTTGYQPSTNLEQVTDWLTKILVGVGLVQLSHVGTMLAEVGDAVSSSLTPVVPGLGVMAQQTLVAFAIVGFLASYLWTRVYYGGIQIGADMGILNMIREQGKAIDLIAKGDIPTQPSAPLPPPPAPAAPAADAPEGAQAAIAPPAFPPEVKERIDRFMDWPAEWNSNPVFELFGQRPAEADGLRLVGFIDAKLESALMMGLRVESRGAPPAGDVLFLMHPTLVQRAVSVPFKGAVAETKFYTEGWFHVVAILDHGRTVLGLDLRDVPGVPKWFKKV